MVYSFNMDSFIILGLSITFGALIGWFAKRSLLFIASIFIAPIVIAGGLYLADLIHMRSIGHSSSESWAGLVIPFLSAGSFMFLTPTALGVAGLKWILSRKWKTQANTVIKLLALIVWALGAVCSSGLMVFVGGGWKQGVLGYVAWALMPYLTIAVIQLCARFFYLSRPVNLLLIWATLVISTIGPLLYVDALFVHVDAQGALAILMIPIIQILLTLLAVMVALYLHWRFRHHVDKPTDNSNASPLFPIPRIMTPLNKPLGILLASAMIIFVFVYALISRLQIADLKTIAIARDMDTFILQYCNNNKVLPTSGVLQKQFPNLNRESGWFFYTDDESYLKTQYPMRWRNNQAIGEPRISEFTATVYAYVVDYKCGEDK